jgi:mRNA-degrading endonuclease toxin of MazEF toxin-antitoxin module
MRGGPILRGRVYATDIESGERFYLVVSNNPRNLQLPRVLAVPLTAESMTETPSVVAIPEGEPFAGHALCDRIGEVPSVEFTRDLGALSMPTMRHVSAGLRAALAL